MSSICEWNGDTVLNDPAVGSHGVPAEFLVEAPHGGTVCAGHLVDLVRWLAFDTDLPDDATITIRRILA